MKFIINFIVAYLAISLIGLVLCLAQIWIGLFLLADLGAFLLVKSDLNDYTNSGIWNLLWFVVTGKIIVSLVIAGLLYDFTGDKDKNENGPHPWDSC